MKCKRVKQLSRMASLIFIILLFGTSSATVVLIGNNISLSFEDVEASFAPAIEGSGVCGMLQLAEPLDACTTLNNKTVVGEGVYSPFALMIRGSCTFEKKVRHAQAAGFAAAIIYNNEDSTDLVSMAGNSDGIHIYAVFVSKAAGETLSKFVGDPSMECWIVPSSDNTAWSAMAIAFISLLAVLAVLATCFFVRRHRLRHISRRSRRSRDYHGMSGRMVKQLPSMIFDSVEDDNCTSETCAICLEDYLVGDKLRVLPCHHKFHLNCIDSWLTKWRTFCPVCKRDARTCTGEPPAGESTPLLSPASSPSFSAPISSSVVLSESESRAVSFVESASRPVSFVGSPAMYIPNPHAGSSYVISYSGPCHRASSHLPPSVASSCMSSVSTRNSVNNVPSLSRHYSDGVMSIQPSSLLSHHSMEALANISPPLSPQSYNSRYGSLFLQGSYSESPHVSISYGRPPRIPSYTGSAMPSYAGSVGSTSPFASSRSLPGYNEESR
eukprot:TRINITY_DN21217_c0_g1_i1.p1 TRINITY_DN21217_c0_g1~~TRINITY_DN21217_c0_g1_i1.p1  ORF type:complete len:496 (-),score=57.35 TRINITY_DN21217_c0_g1_i1:419-1906(-)